MKKIIYSNIFDNNTKFIVDHLKKSLNWEPAFFLGDRDIEKFIKSFPTQTMYAHSPSLRSGIFDYSKIKKKIPIDSKIIQNLSKFESNYLSNLRDTSGWNFSFHERRRYYYDILTYWNSVINQVKPDIFVSYDIPHLECSYSLYLLCKYHYSIPVLFLDDYPHFSNRYIINYSIEDTSVPFKDYHLEKVTKISDDVKKYLGEFKTLPEDMNYLRVYLDLIRRNKKIINVIKQYIKVIANIIVITIKGKYSKVKPLSGFKKNRNPVENSQMSTLEAFFFMRKLKRKGNKTLKYYERISSRVGDKENYIFFAPQFQPEVYSNLRVGIYEDYFLVLDILSKTLPEDWHIYYKEHPMQLIDQYGPLLRDKKFYEKIKSYRNVKIISLKENKLNLIKKSKAVVTSGGTIGWESLTLNKPIMLFGDGWYKSCKSVFNIETLNDATEAIKKIKDGFIPDQNEFEKFANYIYLKSHKNLLSIAEYRNFKLSLNRKALTEFDEKNLKKEFYRVGQAFEEAYKMHYEK